jgi:aminoglycoside 3-N-acetyltransferase I
MDYLFKQLTSSDVLSLKKLLNIFGEAFNEPDTYQRNIPSDAYLKHLLEKDDFIVIVAQTGNAAVGGLVAYVLDKFEQERKEIYIYDLAVLEKHRRLGIATGLILKLRQIGEEKGAYIIFVQADKGDNPAIKLYESLGTCEEIFNFDIEVNPNL